MTDSASLSSALAETLEQAQQALSGVAELAALEQVRNTYLAKKGRFSRFIGVLAHAEASERPALGKIINDARARFEQAFAEKRQALEHAARVAKLAEQTVDITLPGRSDFVGSRHPLSLIRRWIEDWFARLGFVVRTGPEIEDDFHNFTALNIPEHHPARAMQDTFYFDPHTVLRTQTSNVQIHTLKQEAPPIRMIAPGRVYRSDSDMTHTPMFHQCEGLVVDENAAFTELKGLMIALLRAFFPRTDLKIRFRPSFFPFTEPSAEVDIAFFPPGQEASGSWLEVLGCGMVHPNVLQNLAIDPQRYQGYAFGIGLERLAMLRYGVNDLRLFFANDVRFLRQFQYQAGS